MKAKVHKETCIGCGVCAQQCPEVFALSDDSIALVVVDRVPAELKDNCRGAAADCPVEAITMSE